MMLFKRGDRIVRKTSQGGLWTGFVLAADHRMNGEIVVLCETTEGNLFLSDQHHLVHEREWPEIALKELNIRRGYKCTTLTE